LTIWFTDAAVAAWKAEPRTTRGGQRRCLALAINTAPTARAGFRLALRQNEGLLGSIVALLGLDLPVPDHTTLSRRAETLEVPKPRSGTRPIHLLVTARGCSYVVRASRWSRSTGAGNAGGAARCTLVWTPTPEGSSQPSGRRTTSMTHHRLVPCSTKSRAEASFAAAAAAAAAACDQDGVHGEAAARHPAAAVIVPPRSSAVPSATAETVPTNQNQHIRTIAGLGRMGWRKASGYNWRALVEAAIAHFKRVIGGGLHLCTGGRRVTEVAIAVRALNRML
jgi:hypothetical protein